MSALVGLIKIIETINTAVLRVGRTIAWIAVGLMVLVIVIQVFMRYALNAALPWPEEAARFLMLWMTGLMAPSAYRWGGFVSIDLVKEMLGKTISTILNLFILALSLVVLVIALQFAWKHIQSGWLFMSPTLKIPLSLIGLKSVALPKAYIFMSLGVGFVLMLMVNVELMLKNIHSLFDGDADYSKAPDQIVISAE